MKRTSANKTPKTYNAGQWQYRKGPVENVKFDKALRTQQVFHSVNVSRYNAIVFHRKVRLASFVSAPILRKKAPQFENNPTIS